MGASEAQAPYHVRMPGGEEIDSPPRRLPLDSLTSVAVWLALAAAAAVAIVRILSHHPFYDECLHVHKLWLLSSGLEPHRDFWCNYPVAGYILTLPVFSLLPKAAWSVLALRFLMFGLLVAAGWLLGVHGRRTSGSFIWGTAPAALILFSPPLGRFLAEYSIDHFAMVAAVGAVVLFFTRPRPFRVGAAAALCLFSVVLTPKYAMPLFFGLVGFAAAAVIAARRILPATIAIGAGAGAAALLSLALYALAGVSPSLNLRYAHLLMAEFKLVADPAPVSLATSTFGLLLRNLPLLGLILAGLAGFASWVRGRLLARGLAPLGLLGGAFASAILTKTFMAQYILPVTVCLVAFAPFARRLVRSESASRLLTPALAMLTIGAGVLALAGALSGFERTPLNVRDEYGIVAERAGLEMGLPAVKSLRETQRLLDLIPPGERVVAHPQVHPLFRRDLTFLTADEQPSFATLLDADDPVRAFFQPMHLVRRLDEEPPAYISMPGLTHIYPREWLRVLDGFLRRGRTRYVPLEGMPGGFLRIDLIR